MYDTDPFDKSVSWIITLISVKKYEVAAMLPNVGYMVYKIGQKHTPHHINV